MRIARHRRIDFDGPGLYATVERLGLFKSLAVQPCGHGEGALAKMADDDKALVGIQLLVCARGNVAGTDRGDS